MSRSGVTIRLTALALVATASAASTKQVHTAGNGRAPVTHAEIQPVDGGYAIVVRAPGSTDPTSSRDTLLIGASVKIDRTLVESPDRLVRSDRP